MEQGELRELNAKETVRRECSISSFNGKPAKIKRNLSKLDIAMKGSRRTSMRSRSDSVNSLEGPLEQAFFEHPSLEQPRQCDNPVEPRRQSVIEREKIENQKQIKYQRACAKEVLKNVKLFESFEEDGLEKLVSELKLATYEKGSFVVQQGSIGQEFYVIIEGTASVVQKKDPTDFLERARVLQELKQGDHFGEMALLNEEARTASIVVSSDKLIVLYITKKIFEQINGYNSSNMEESMRKRAAELVMKVSIFKDLTLEQKQEMIQIMKIVRYDSTQVVFHQEERAREFFLVIKGQVKVTVRKTINLKRITEEEVCRLGAGEYFGELALLPTSKDNKRTATVTCTRPTMLMSLPRSYFNKILAPEGNNTLLNHSVMRFAKDTNKKEYIKRPSASTTTLDKLVFLVQANKKKKLWVKTVSYMVNALKRNAYLQLYVRLKAEGDGFLDEFGWASILSEIAHPHVERSRKATIEMLRRASFRILGKSPQDRSEEELHFLHALTSANTLRNKLLTTWRPHKYLDLCRHMVLQQYPALSYIYQHDTIGEGAFMILRGCVRVMVHDKESESIGQLRYVEQLKPGDTFGCLESRMLRSTTIVAVTNVDVIKVQFHEKTFKMERCDWMSTTVDARFQYLQQLPVFSTADPYKLYRICGVLEDKCAEHGFIILGQQEPSDGLYFMLEGSVSIIREGGGSVKASKGAKHYGEETREHAYDPSQRRASKRNVQSQQSIVLSSLGPGSYFGEKSLIACWRHNLSSMNGIKARGFVEIGNVVAATHCKMLFLALEHLRMLEECTVVAIEEDHEARHSLRLNHFQKGKAAKKAHIDCSKPRLITFGNARIGVVGEVPASEADTHTSSLSKKKALDFIDSVSKTSSSIQARSVTPAGATDSQHSTTPSRRSSTQHSNEVPQPVRLVLLDPELDLSRSTIGNRRASFVELSSPIMVDAKNQASGNRRDSHSRQEPHATRDSHDQRRDSHSRQEPHATRDSHDQRRDSHSRQEPHATRDSHDQRRDSHSRQEPHSRRDSHSRKDCHTPQNSDTRGVSGANQKPGMEQFSEDQGRFIKASTPQGYTASSPTANPMNGIVPEKRALVSPSMFTPQHAKKLLSPSFEPRKFWASQQVQEGEEDDEDALPNDWIPTASAPLGFMPSIAEADDTHSEHLGSRGATRKQRACHRPVRRPSTASSIRSEDSQRDHAAHDGFDSEHEQQHSRPSTALGMRHEKPSQNQTHSKINQTAQIPSGASFFGNSELKPTHVERRPSTASPAGHSRGDSYQPQDNDQLYASMPNLSGKGLALQSPCSRLAGSASCSPTHFNQPSWGQLQASGAAHTSPIVSRPVDPCMRFFSENERPSTPEVLSENESSKATEGNRLHSRRQTEATENYTEFVAMLNALRKDSTLEEKQVLRSLGVLTVVQEKPTKLMQSFEKVILESKAEDEKRKDERPRTDHLLPSRPFNHSVCNTSFVKQPDHWRTGQKKTSMKPDVSCCSLAPSLRMHTEPSPCDRDKTSFFAESDPGGRGRQRSTDTLGSNFNGKAHLHGTLESISRPQTATKPANSLNSYINSVLPLTFPEMHPKKQAAPIFSFEGMSKQGKRLSASIKH